MDKQMVKSETKPSAGEKPLVSAIVLAGGSGSRMGGKKAKQYMELGGIPVLVHSLKTFAACPFVDEIVVVVRESEEVYCRTEIIDKYHIPKVSSIVCGGASRSDSVYEGVSCANGFYVMIHDGARPFVSEKVIQHVYEGMTAHRACICGMPVKDTIKLLDSEQNVSETPRRSSTWLVQTPQGFEKEVLLAAYDGYYSRGDGEVTDDASLVEQFTSVKVKVVEGDYRNIKLTTPEDKIMAEAFYHHPNSRYMQE